VGFSTEWRPLCRIHRHHNSLELRSIVSGAPIPRLLRQSSAPDRFRGHRRRPFTGGLFLRKNQPNARDTASGFAWRIDAESLVWGYFGADAGSFTTIWLRFEFVTWIAVAWLMGVFAGLVMPAGPAPLFWTIMPPFYAILWSAFRLAFCLGILSFTGPLLAPVLWFAMGALADMLYISVFYSFIAAHASSLRRNEAG
jgi:hypothetical protein